MKKILLVLALFALHMDIASAVGRARYELEGEIKVRFYYDQAFYSNGFFNYNNLQTDLMNALQTTGTYGTGLKYVADTSNYNFLVNMGSKAMWSEREVQAWLQTNLPLQAGLVKVLIHARGMSNNGICYEDIPDSNISSYAMGYTYRALPTGGKAQSHIMVTAKTTCSVNAGLRSQADLKETFVHELGHAVAHPGNGSTWKECTTAPFGSIMCHGVKPGLRRGLNTWFTSDVTLIRTEVFDTATRKFPKIMCYEYSSYQHCDNECINTAGFPNQGATEIYEQCRRTYCDRMCR